MGHPPLPSTPTSTGHSTVNLIVGVAELKVANQTNNVITTIGLGSCLGITCYDPVNHVGGLLHAMLPDSKNYSGHSSNQAMFVDTGIAELVESMLRHGAHPRNLMFKIFGGAQVLKSSNYFSIGRRNIAMMQSLASHHRLVVKAWEVGGQLNRSIRLHLDDGRVRLRMPSQPEVIV
jgi:chemotaxis protein CheD